MKKKLTLFILIILLLLPSCSRNETIIRDYTMKGEGEHWIADYKGYSKGNFYKENGRLHYKANSKETLTITYKGELSELSSVKEIAYEFANSIGRSTQTFEKGPFKKAIVWNHGGSGDLPLEEQREELIIIIDGKPEIIKMEMVK